LKNYLRAKSRQYRRIDEKLQKQVGFPIDFGEIDLFFIACSQNAQKLFQISVKFVHT